MEPIATRAAAQRILGRISPSAWKSLAVIAICVNVAFAVAFWPEHDGLSREGIHALFILVLCAGLWFTEAMPAFAVSLLAIGLEIALLGHSSSGDHEWEKYIATWGSPLIWLFFGGFVLAAGAEKTGLDRWMASRILVTLGVRPGIVLFGIMLATAILSMFVSNTATATIMVAALSPLSSRKLANKSLVTALLLGTAMAANIGGMGTVIGTPPNAIVSGSLAAIDEISFLEWMVLGLPPALFLLVIAWGYLCVFYLGGETFKNCEGLRFETEGLNNGVPRIQCTIVVATFTATILMWILSPFHGLPTTVVSFLPICCLTATQILSSKDIRTVPWDVLLLIAGGLSLGVAVKDTGLAGWLVALLPTDGLSTIPIALAFSYLMLVLSNLMSNTAATNMLTPLMLAILGSCDAYLAVAAALSASAAMCLPISTPPNAIVYGTNRISSFDLLFAGIVVGIPTPLIAIWWIVRAYEWIS